MGFIRVRGKKPGDPLHEFDVPEAEAQQHPDLYKVIDPKPVATARPASFMPGRVPEETKPVKRTPATRKRPSAKRAPKPGEDSTAPAGGTVEK